jgi:hypothetical protein
VEQAQCHTINGATGGFHGDVTRGRVIPETLALTMSWKASAGAAV